MTPRQLLVAIAVALAVPASAAASPAQNGTFANGTFANGTFANGKFANAAVMGGETIAGIAAAPPEKAGFYLWDTHVKGNALAGWAWDYATSTWAERSGEFYMGTKLPIRVIDAETGAEQVGTATIDLIYPSGSDLLHMVTVTLGDQQFPLCEVDGVPRPAVVLRGEWSYEEYVPWGGDQISDEATKATFACVDTGALGKCAVGLGYRRWIEPFWEITGWNGSWFTFQYVDFALDHQACTRMIRADYCGNGHSWTANGTEIDVYDKQKHNTQSVSVSSSWEYEATWSPDGAVRIACDRILGKAVYCPTGNENPWEVIPQANRVCYTGDGMENPAARLGNLRRQNIVFPWPFPIKPL